MNELILDGCGPVPLASYLKALGILRLVADQADPHVRGWWDSDRFRLGTVLDQNSLSRFFLEDYRPTPIIAPWNAGSGFYFRERKSNYRDPVSGKKLKLGIRDEATLSTKVLAKFELTSSDRLSDYRDAIRISRSILRDLELTAAPSGKLKDRLIAALRNTASAELVNWIDAAAILLPDGAKYPPLLGTGGNDGNLDFSTNFLQRTADVIELDTGAPTDRARSLLEGALFETAVVGLQETAIGQFAPGAAGGPNSAAGFEGPARVNPWDFVLMVEGALVFAGGVSRRFEGTGAAYLSYPFMVRAVAAGFGSGSLDEQAESRGELWAPLWARPATYGEVRVLFREGRLSVGARPARDGLDAARSVSALGTDRRIVAFERYGFFKRQGLAYLATPLGRREVKPNPQSELVTDLDRGRWLDALREKAATTESPGEFKVAVLRLEDSLFAFLEKPKDAQSAQSVLIAVGRVARIVAERPKLQDDVRPISPPPRLRAAWVEAADDGSFEFRLAVALAGLRAGLPTSNPDREFGPQDGEASGRPRFGLAMREHIAPLDPEAHSRQPRWNAEKSGALAVWSAGSLVENLCAIAQRRLVEQTRRGLEQAPFDGEFGVDSGEIATFLAESVRDEQIADLCLGLAWVEPSRWKRAGRPARLPFAYAALKPLFTPSVTLGNEALHLPMPAAVPPLLASGRVTDAVRLAQERAQASGLPTPFLDHARSRAKGRGPNVRFGRRLLASLVIPVSARVVGDCLNQAYPSSDEGPKDAA